MNVGLMEEEGRAIMTVRDSGIGIPAEMLPQLFRMFYQDDGSSLSVKSGLGIGLALAKILVEMHDGSITAYSRGAGQGAEFIVRLPLAERAAAVQTSSAPRILLVDDNADHLLLLAALLDQHGYKVVTAMNASEALQRAAEIKPHACIIDIGLPDMNGGDLARRLRDLPETRDSRIIAVTGYGRLMADEQAQAGFDCYLTKPTDLDQLIRALN